MGLLSHLFFLHLFVLVCIANIEIPIKQFRDGSKSSFIQAPYIITARDETVKEIQEEITNSWPEGIITYYLDENSYDLSIGARIRTAMSALEAAACIRFRDESTKPDGDIRWIHITNPNKKRQCLHYTESGNKGEIMLTLGYDCLEQEDLIHSLLHGIGFKDEITHPHRDKYIRVLWDNIQPVYRHLYRIQPLETSRSIVEYDPLSIMHFHDRAFSSNGKATIVPLESGLVISPSDSLSQLDKMRLHLYFGHECNKRKFSSLMETCKNSLKSEQEIQPDDDRGKVDEDHNSGKVTVDDNKENENSQPSTEDNVKSGNKTENENSDGNIEHTKSDEGKETPDEKNVSGDIKKQQEETENSEENDVSDDKKKSQDEKQNAKDNIVDKKQNSKQGDGAENADLTTVTVVKGLIVPNKKIPSNIPKNNKKKDEEGINFSYDSAEK